jgi:hypothetical protein
MCNPWKVSLCLALAAVIGCAGPDGTGKGTTDKKASLEGAGKKVGEEAKKLGDEAKKFGQETKEKAGEAAKKVGEEAKKIGEETKEKAGEAAKKVGEEAKKLGDEVKKFGQETKEKAGEAAKKVGEFTAELKDKHLGEMKDKLGDCDKQIAELKEKLGGLTGDVKTQLAAKIAGLEELRKKTGEAFDKLKDGTKDNWAGLTKDYDGMMEKLTNGIKDADEHVNKK